MGTRLRLAVAATMSALVLGACDEQEEPTAPTTDRAGEQAAAIRSVFLGVSCPEPNSIRCDTVRLSVSLREPAEAVRASIAGRSFPLELGECLAPQGGRNFCGALHPAGLKGEGELAVNADDGRWIGNPPVRPEVLLIVRDRAGVVSTQRLRTQLRAGFG
jgi:hypothetical protein